MKRFLRITLSIVAILIVLYFMSMIIGWERGFDTLEEIVRVVVVVCITIGSIGAISFINHKIKYWV